MQLIMGGVNGHYLRDITENAARSTEEVLAAVAYANDSRLLFEWCRKQRIPLKFWGRLDSSVAVSVKILKEFIAEKSPSYTCKLVKHHHAKVIWWRGYGLYIGSANLTDSAWYRNVEAGCFFEETEIDAQTANEITSLFATLDRHATPLTEELLNVMSDRAAVVTRSKPEDGDFWENPSIVNWNGLTHVSNVTATDRRRVEFLEEWHATLQELRNIGEIVSRPENRPSWIGDDVPKGAQADQFLHAHYYQRTFQGNKAAYETHYEDNKTDPAGALVSAIDWWRKPANVRENEDRMLNIDAPYLREHLSQPALLKLGANEFREICGRVHSIVDYARRVRNTTMSLANDGRGYSIPEKLDALSTKIWESRTGNGSSVVELLNYVLYGGSADELPTRLWSAISDAEWKMECLGVSALGEIVGWALPDTFPPRNGRTSKALRSLGYDVRIHV